MSSEPDSKILEVHNIKCIIYISQIIHKCNDYKIF